MIAFLLAGLLAQDPVTVAGKSIFVERPWFARLAGDAREARRVAVETINRSLGARYEDKGTVLFRFQDLTEEGARTRPSGTQALRNTQVVEGREVQVIEFYLEFLENRQAVLADEVLHEMTHAVMREQMDRESYVAIPDWIREGIAVHVAGQTEALARYVLSKQRGDDPLAFLDGLDPEKDGYDDYPEDALAIEYLSSRREGALAALYDSLVRKKTPWKEAIAEAAGQKWEEFAPAALGFARQRLSPLVREGYAAFLVAHRLFRTEGKANESEDAFQRAIEAAPTGPWSAPSRYFMGRAEELCRKFDPGRQTLRLFLEIDRGKSACDDDARFTVAEIESTAGCWRAAAEEYAAYIREYPYAASRLPEAHARRVECLVKDGNRRDAAAEMATLERLYPDHAATLRAKKALR